MISITGVPFLKGMPFKNDTILSILRKVTFTVHAESRTSFRSFVARRMGCRLSLSPSAIQSHREQTSRRSGSGSPFHSSI